MKRTPTALLVVAPVVLAAAMVFAYTQPVSAQTDRCALGHRLCYARAMFGKDIWEVIIAFFDCDLDEIDCVRRVLIGR